MKSVIKTTRKSNSFYFQAVAGWGEGRSRAEGATTTWRPPGGAGSLLWELRAAAHVAGGARWRRPSPSAMSPAAPTGRAAGPSPGGAGGCSPSAAAEMSFSTSRRWAAGAGQGRTGRCGRRGGLKLGAFFPPRRRGERSPPSLGTPGGWTACDGSAGETEVSGPGSPGTAALSFPLPESNAFALELFYIMQLVSVTLCFNGNFGYGSWVWRCAGCNHCHCCVVLASVTKSSQN